MADPNDDRHIPDLTVINPTDSVFPQVLLDVSITSPLTGALYGQLDNAVSRELAGQQGRMAKKRFQEKKTNKYRARVVANGFGFVPTIFEPSATFTINRKNSFKFPSRKQWKQEILVGTMLMHIYLNVFQLHCKRSSLRMLTSG
jgi:hypothetical protein